MNYSVKGCTNFLAGYCLAFVEDAAEALARPDRANERQHAALARLQNGAVGWHRDLFIDIAATATGQNPKDVYRGLLERAKAKAGKRKPVVNYPVWAERVAS